MTCPISIRFSRWLLPAFLGLLTANLVACSDEAKQAPIAAQHWNDIDVRIETHPNPPQAGMSEIVVIVTGPRGRPVQDLLVSLRAAKDVPWVQAIQDGLIGVYRRAIDLGDNDATELQVRLQRGTDEQVLFFPLKLAGS
ncbi:hypothetical protein MIZ01_2412 [Sideroxyarcus emersonii]|uniref:Uncharacterized protein n=1 Tax=Sideroxyarcus emersonii TaxID=2764705 RepID=A0AAN1XCG8_9PROT|nr:hypothetical protein [Sideroxyarcus emersonii]BCK88607.1 hypothetical protein MIZ01_2412 [Sideroxyarcus emersonii]